MVYYKGDRRVRTQLWDAEIPEGAVTMPTGESMRVDRVILSNPRPVHTFWNLNETIAMLSKWPRNIAAIPCPTRDMQLAAVRTAGLCIELIDYPDAEVQTAAVMQLEVSITRIRKPCVAAQLAAVRADGRLVMWFDNPSLEVQMAAVQQYPLSITAIAAPYPEVVAEANRLAPMYRFVERPPRRKCAIQ